MIPPPGAALLPSVPHVSLDAFQGTDGPLLIAFRLIWFQTGYVFKVLLLFEVPLALVLRLSQILRF